MANADYKIILDLPATNPALGFDNVAEALKDIVEGSRPQFAIGIFGAWGSGKTTLMNAIRGKLNKTKTIAVDFSAWRYEKEQHLIVPLLDTIREDLLRWSEENKTFKEEAVKTAETVGKAIYSLLAGMNLKFGLPGSLAVSFDANKALDRAEKFGEQNKDAATPRSFYHATFKALSEAFSSFLKTETDRRIVVFIDDLDRCLPQGALEVLESMKLFFDLPGFVFVVGLDQAVVERTIDLKYIDQRPKVDGKEGSASYQVRGADYIKKIFQLPYAVAPVAVNQLEEFLEAIYAEGELSDAQTIDLREVVTPHLRFLISESTINPREIKRFINAYTLVIKIKKDPVKDVVLALQTLKFRLDWATAWKAVLTHRDVFLDAVNEQVSGNNSTAIVDLDPSFAGVPESFLTYVTAPNPGAPLLTVNNLDEYIYTGEATTSTQGSIFLDAIRDVARVTEKRRLLEASPLDQDLPAFSNYVSAVTSALGKVNQVSYGRLNRLTQTWDEHLRLNRSTLAPAPDADNPRKMWIEEEEALRRKLLAQLLELYQTGSSPDPTSSSAA
jgi:predicted KAP-like P-loop ATPase